VSAGARWYAGRLVVALPLVFVVAVSLLAGNVLAACVAVGWILFVVLWARLSVVMYVFGFFRGRIDRDRRIEDPHPWDPPPPAPTASTFEVDFRLPPTVVDIRSFADHMRDLGYSAHETTVAVIGFATAQEIEHRDRGVEL